MRTKCERTEQPLALYIHVPFCIKKCAYCDFLSAPAALNVQREYVKALKREIAAEAKRAAEYKVISVFFGGGTPSILETGEIAEILKVIADSFRLCRDAEITVECNPGTLDAAKLASYRQAGANRLSIGLQSADNRELVLLGRIHTWEEFLDSYRLARAAGFQNINIDLMSALPGQTLSSYTDTLKKVIALEPEHISAYSLMIEEGTPFYERYGTKAKEKSGAGHGKCREQTGKTESSESLPENDAEVCKEPAALPDEETERLMYEQTGLILKQAGYDRYEISNYAKAGRECRHNICYWERTEYLGFGTGAASLFRGCRFERERELAAYLRRIEGGGSAVTNLQQLSKQDAMEEFMFLGLRMMKGIEKSRFRQEFGQDIYEVYGDVLYKYKRLELLAEEDDKICLTGRGIDVSNVIFSDFIL